jgi:hypothetical protein
LFIYFWAPCWLIYFIHVCFVCFRIPAGSAVPSSRTAFLPLSIPNPKTQSNTLTPSTTGE